MIFNHTNSGSRFSNGRLLTEDFTFSFTRTLIFNFLYVNTIAFDKYFYNLFTITAKECDEPMGFENGIFGDDQIEVSSYMGSADFYSKSNARLNFTGSIFGAAGAWVAEGKPNQFIRVRKHMASSRPYC